MYITTYVEELTTTKETVMQNQNEVLDGVKNNSLTLTI